MNKLIKKTKADIFGQEIDFRVKLFNIMATGGAAISFFTIIQSVLIQMWGTLLVSFVMMNLSIGLVIYAAKSGKYHRCYNITIFFIFFIFFPVLFFQSGGYKGGVPAVFIFAVLFTVLMLEGVRSLAISALELMVYGIICFIAYKVPDSVVQYATEKERVIDIIFSYAAIGMVCSIILFLHIKEYFNQRKLLEEQNEKLKHYDDVKSTFLTTVAHEIKNPLNIIGLYAQDTYELAEEKQVDLEQICYNQKIIGNTVTRLDRIVMDLMDTVSIEQGRMNLCVASMDMAELIKEAVKVWKEKENTNGNVIVLDLPKGKNIVAADHTRMFQVMTNLLSNASIHTQNGIITIKLRKRNGEQCITVKDTGEGMKEEIRKQAFKGYVSTSRDYWRHGIGLYICHQIVESHGGRIWIESELGKGTKISFTIPIKERSNE